MTRLLAIPVVSAIILLGCTPQNVRSIEVGTPRVEVEEILGEPLAREETSLGVIYTYSFIYDANESDTLPTDYGGCVGACAMAYLLILPLTLVVDASGINDEEHHLHIVYGPDSRAVELVDVLPDGQSAEEAILRERERQRLERERQKLERERQEEAAALCKQPLTEAMMIDAEAQLQRAIDCGEFGHQAVFRWRCLAAHQRSHSAQNHVGHYYRVGSDPIQQDFVEAYKWYSLAAASGNKRAAELRQKASAKMTPAQIAEAGRLVTEWDPNPAECDEIAAQAGN
jgi:hypothetical protein